MITYENIIFLAWIAFIVVWAVMAFNVKKDISRDGAGGWGSFARVRLLLALVLAIFVALRLATHTARFPNSFESIIISRSFYHPSLFFGWLAALVAVTGVSFAIWARVHLGRNWSPLPSIKQHHELVTTGPYAFVRHPIYTGGLLMAFSVVLLGTYFGLIVFTVALVAFLARVRKEEQIMLALFPNEYPAYQKRTKRIIPFVW